jgi:hypothetical protein
MHKPFRILLKSAFVLAFAANTHAQGIPERVSALEATVASLRAQINTLRAALLEHRRHEDVFITDVNCTAGETIADVLNDRQAQIAPGVYIVISGTCLENVNIGRDNVEIVGGGAGATIEAADGPAVFITGQNTRLNNLTIRSPHRAVWVRHGHLEGGGLRLIGGLSALMGSTVRLYDPTVIEGAAEVGVDIWEESSVALNNCTVSGSGFDGVRVAQSTFAAYMCAISGSTWAGVRVGDGSNVSLDSTTITANEDGVIIGDSSVLRSALGTSITGNTSAGIRCAPSPAVPQLIGVTSATSTGNPGGNFVNCAGH